jgi:hypothetical protein
MFCLMTRRNAGALAGLLLSISALGQTELRHIRYSNTEQDYDLRYDSAKTAGYDIGQIVWLSPYYRAFGQVPFEIGWGYDGPGRPNKTIMFFGLEHFPNPVAAALETEHKPVPRRPDPDIPEYLSFLRGNLNFGKDEIARLRSMKIPPTLEPIRRYMLEFLERDVTWGEARYEYARTGDSAFIKDRVCGRCPCSAEEETRIAELSAQQSVTARLRSSADWTNRVIQCGPNENQKKSPLEAWNQFLREFDIQETHREKGPE